MKMRSSSSHLVNALLALCLHHVSLVAAFPPSQQHMLSGSSDRHGYTGAVASEAKECSAIGKDLLTRGGNAVDAMVGTTFCVGVVGMYHSGIGGGGFALLRDKQGGYEAVDFREAAPAAAFEDMYLGNVNGSIVGGLAAGVPSEVRGLGYMHDKYGELPWKTVMAGAIKVARDGFRVSPDLMYFVKDTIKTNGNYLVEEPSWAEDFAPNGTLIKEGDIMTRKRYAKTLEIIAEEGPDAFYTGKLADSWIKIVQETNGTMTHDDLINYKVISRPVIQTTFRGINLYGMPSPAGGAVALNILKTMEQYDLADLADAGLSYHRYDEAMRFAYSARVELGDPDFVEGTRAMERDMLQDTYSKAIRDRISDNRTHPVKYYDPKGLYTSESHGTSHLVTADRDGMAVTLTTTINLIFGAKTMDPVTGVILNNEMNDFSIPNVHNEFGYVPSPANFIRPFKRPLSSCTPIIAAFPNGTLLAAVGASGGSHIVSSTAQVVWSLLDHNMTMAGAIRQPRLHDQLMPNRALVEEGFDDGLVEELQGRGHVVEVKKGRMGISAVQGVRREGDGRFEAASESRQANSAGYSV